MVPIFASWGLIAQLREAQGTSWEAYVVAIMTLTVRKVTPWIDSGFHCNHFTFVCKISQVIDKFIVSTRRFSPKYREWLCSLDKGKGSVAVVCISRLGHKHTLISVTNIHHSAPAGQQHDLSPVDVE